MEVNHDKPESWEQKQFFIFKHNNIRKYSELRFMNGSINGCKLSPGV